MAKAFDLHIKENNIAKASKEFEKQAKIALEKCGLVAESYAKQNLTDLQAVDTGALRNSITHKVVYNDQEKACHVGSKLKYAPYVEFGTGIHYSGGRRTSWVVKGKTGKYKGKVWMTNGMKPRPYLKPAVADHEKQYRDIIHKELHG